MKKKKVVVNFYYYRKWLQHLAVNVTLSEVFLINRLLMRKVYFSTK